MINRDAILKEIAVKGKFLHHPGNWDEVEWESLQALVNEGIIEPLSKTDPNAMNADYIYVAVNPI